MYFFLKMFSLIVSSWHLLAEFLNLVLSSQIPSLNAFSCSTLYFQLVFLNNCLFYACSQWSLFEDIDYANLKYLFCLVHYFHFL